MKRKFLGTIFGTIIWICCILFFTYAFYSWRSEENTVVEFSITDGSTLTCESGEDVVYSGLGPVIDYRDGAFQTFVVSNSGNSEADFAIMLNITRIDASLNNVAFKYKLVMTEVINNQIDEEGITCTDINNSACTEVVNGSGSFESLGVGTHILVDSITVPDNTTYQYYLFIYIDGNLENSLDMRESVMVSVVDICNEPPPIVPSCTIDIPSDVTIGGSIVSKVLCTDDNFEAPTLNTSNFFVSDTSVATIQSVSAPKAISGGYQYDVTIKGLMAGTYSLGINADLITDFNGYTNESAESNDANVIKKTPSITTSTTALMANYANGSSFTYTYDGDGELKCISSDEKYITCSVNTANNTVTITPVTSGGNSLSIGLYSLEGVSYQAGGTVDNPLKVISVEVVGGITPTISLISKTAPYVGTPIESNTATVTLSDGSTYNGSINYTYYSNSTCNGNILDSVPTDVGNYSVMASIEGSGWIFDASSSCVAHIIEKSSPTINLISKSATYTGNPIVANTATAWTSNGTSVSLNYTYTYYSGETCSESNKLTVAPTDVGNYSVKATSTATSNLNSASSNCATHTIIADKVYTLSFNSNGGSGSMNNLTCYVTNGTSCTVTLPTNTFTYNYHTFETWSTDSAATTGSAVGTTVTLTSDATYYAIWRTNKVLVQYYADGGSWGGSTFLRDGDNYTVGLNSSGYITWGPSNVDITTNPVYQTKYEYNQTGIDLRNWDNKDFINIYKVGMMAKTGEEWKIIDGEITFDDDATDITASSLCNAINSDCVVTLKVNWVDFACGDVGSTVRYAAKNWTVVESRDDDPSDSCRLALNEVSTSKGKFKNFPAKLTTEYFSSSGDSYNPILVAEANASNLAILNTNSVTINDSTVDTHYMDARSNSSVNLEGSSSNKVAYWIGGTADSSNNSYIYLGGYTQYSCSNTMLGYGGKLNDTITTVSGCYSEPSSSTSKTYLISEDLDNYSYNSSYTTASTATRASKYATKYTFDSASTSTSYITVTVHRYTIASSNSFTTTSSTPYSRSAWAWQFYNCGGDYDGEQTYKAVFGSATYFNYYYRGKKYADKYFADDPYLFMGAKIDLTSYNDATSGLAGRVAYLNYTSSQASSGTCASFKKRTMTTTSVALSYRPSIVVLG